MEEFSITVTIADRIYRLTIEKSEEEAVRKAARLIDEKIRDYAKSYAFKDKQDLLAMVTLQFTTSMLHKESAQESAKSELSAKIRVIEEILDQQLEKQNVL